MSIEVSSAAKGVKAASGADPHSKKAEKTAEASGGSGFSALMNLLSAAEDGAAGLTAEALLADAPPTEKDGLGVDVTAALPLQPFAVAQQPVGGAMPLPASDPLSLPANVVKEAPLLTAESIGLPGKAGQHAKMAGKGGLLKSALASTGSNAPGVNTSAQAAADLTQASPVSALLAHKNAVQAQTLNGVAQDLKEARGSVSLQSVVPAADAATALLAGGQSDLVRPQGRFGARAGSGQSGSSGFESAFGQAMVATNRSESVFQVPPASAVVPDTAVAETVSYWASHGVQTAELTLEGFGDAPVEVSILLSGDQAQIDFRTDQPGVRQVLENAAAQLKDMLSSQGLQLAGVSVGSSGTGGEPGGERRQRSAAQQVSLVKTDAVGAVTTRSANPAVGRSLDLFV